MALRLILLLLFISAAHAREEGFECDPHSEFLQETPIICGDCEADEVCIVARYDTDNLKSLQKRWTSVVKAVLQHEYSLTSQACTTAIRSMTQEMSQTALDSIKKYKNHPKRNHKKQKGLLIPFSLSSVLHSPDIRRSCGTDCTSAIQSGKEWATELTKQSTLIRETDVKLNTSDWIRELNVPPVCHGRFATELRKIFREKMSRPGLLPATDSLATTPDGGRGHGTGAGPGNFAEGSPDGNGPLACQKIPGHLIKRPEGESVSCQISHNDLYRFYTETYVAGLNRAFKSLNDGGFVKTPIRECSAAHMLGDRNKPSEQNELMIPFLCANDCVTSTDILSMLSIDTDRENAKLVQQMKDQLTSMRCKAQFIGEAAVLLPTMVNNPYLASSLLATIGQSGTSTGDPCYKYLQHYADGRLRQNAARMIGPEIISQLDKELWRFEEQNRDNPQNRIDYIRMPTAIEIPGLGRKVCLTGSKLPPFKSVDIYEGRVALDEEYERSVVWDRNVTQGLTGQVASWVSLITFGGTKHMFPPQDEELDCISLPARLVRKAIQTDCGGIDTIREMVYEAMRHQGQGKTMANGSVGVIIGVIAPEGVVGSMISACLQGAGEAKLELNSRDERIDAVKKKMTIEELEELEKQAAMMKKFFEENKGRLTGEKERTFLNSAWALSQSCLKTVASAGIFMGVQKLSTGVLKFSPTLQNVAMLQRGFSPTRQMMADVLVEAAASRTLRWESILLTIPIDLKPRGHELQNLLKEADLQMKATGQVDPTLVVKIKNILSKIPFTQQRIKEVFDRFKGAEVPESPVQSPPAKKVSNSIIDEAASSVKKSDVQLMTHLEKRIMDAVTAYKKVDGSQGQSPIELKAKQLSLEKLIRLMSTQPKYFPQVRKLFGLYLENYPSTDANQLLTELSKGNKTEKKVSQILRNDHPLRSRSEHSPDGPSKPAEPDSVAEIEGKLAKGESVYVTVLNKGIETTWLVRDVKKHFVIGFNPITGETSQLDLKRKKVFLTQVMNSLGENAGYVGAIVHFKQGVTSFIGHVISLTISEVRIQIRDDEGLPKVKRLKRSDFERKLKSGDISLEEDPELTR